MAVDSQVVRERLGYPVIDIDGHLVEHMPEVAPFVREYLSAPLFDRWIGGEFTQLFAVTGATNAERSRTRVPQAGWWGAPTANTFDRATAMLPGLLYDRMDELGFDLTVLYPTAGFGIAGVPDDELRRGLCAGWNAVPRVGGQALSRPHPRRRCDPDAHSRRGSRRARPLPGARHRRRGFPAWCGASDRCAAQRPGSRSRGPVRRTGSIPMDSTATTTTTPVWQRCRELRLPVTFHGGLAFDNRHMQSPSNFVWNHLGLHASMMFQVARSLVLGGVTQRFADLSFAFLECGVAWAASLASDLVEHWERRSPEGLQATDPERLDVAELAELFERYGRSTEGLERLARAGWSAARRARRLRAHQRDVVRRTRRATVGSVLLRM